MKVEITLTPTDVARLAELRKLKESAGDRPYTDEAMVAMAVSIGLHEAILAERAYTEAIENPASMDANRLAFLARQAS